MSLKGIIITCIRPKSQQGAQILYKYTRRCKNVLEKDKMGFQKKYKKGLHLTGSIEQMTLYALPISLLIYIKYGKEILKIQVKISSKTEKDSFKDPYFIKLLLDLR